MEQAMNNTNGLIIACIQAASNGITSPEICSKYPFLNKSSITSAISKFKSKGLVVGVAQEGSNSALLFTPGNYVKFSSATSELVTSLEDPDVTIVATQEGNGHDTEEMISLEVSQLRRVLLPFAKFAEAMIKNSPTDQSSVWLSATTAIPTVTIEDGSAFIEALKLLETIS